MSHRVLRVSAILLLLLAGSGAFSYFQYRGMTLGMINHARHATIRETKNLMICIRYWLKYMEKLSFDQEAGAYAFPKPRVARGFDNCALAFHRGEFQDAVTCFEAEVEDHGESEENLFWLAMSYLRQAEAKNCLEPLETASDHDHGSFCTLPLNRYHQRQEYSRRAAEVFEQLLDQHASDNRLYRWLLSFSAMTIDGFPDQVPERYRINGHFIDTFERL